MLKHAVLSEGEETFEDELADGEAQDQTFPGEAGTVEEGG